MHIDGGIDHETQKVIIIGEKKVLREGRRGIWQDSRRTDYWGERTQRGHGEERRQRAKRSNTGTRRHENTTSSCSNLKLNLKKRSVLKTKFYRVSIIHLWNLSEKMTFNNAYMLNIIFVSQIRTGTQSWFLRLRSVEQFSCWCAWTPFVMEKCAAQMFLRECGHTWLYLWAHKIHIWYFTVPFGHTEMHSFSQARAEEGTHSGGRWIKPGLLYGTICLAQVLVWYSAENVKTPSSPSAHFVFRGVDFKD